MVRLVPAIVHCLLAIVNHSKAGGGSGLLIGLANVSLIHKLHNHKAIYWVVLSATGSVYGDTVWYLVALAQFSAILVGT